MVWKIKPRGNAEADDKRTDDEPATETPEEDRGRIVNGIRVSDGVAIIRRGG